MNHLIFARDWGRLRFKRLSGDQIEIELKIRLASESNEHPSLEWRICIGESALQMLSSIGR